MTVQEWLGQNNQLGIDIWEKKYRYENETFDEWLDRVSGGDKEVAQLIKNKKFLFGGRILANRGLNKYGKKVTYSNCYVIAPPEDNIESIYSCASKLARTFSMGGGCGIDISKLAPKGARVNNAAKETSGAVSFMDTYSQVTDQIGQNGRRGALMISMDCHHPDLEDFIDIKTDLNRVTKANISIRFADDFMQAVKDNSPFNLSFTRKETGEIINKTINARDVFMKLAKNNWDFAEPGCLYWDTICDYNLLANTKEFEYAGTNPCAEEPLPAGGSCLLGSLNLSEFVLEDGRIDYDSLKHTVQIAIKALNDVLDEGLPLHPLQEQRDSVRDWRQCGLGIMGLADMLIKMGVKYGSDASINICDDIGRFIANTAIMTSAMLAEENGAFPKCNIEEVCSTDFFMNHIGKLPYTDYQYVMQNGLRNSQLLTIAPTGTLSTMLGISGGIEPIFANSYERTTKSLHGEDVVYKVYTPIVQKYMNEHSDIKDDKQLPDYFVTANDLDYHDRINMQSVWQKHIDASISSTVNVPNNFTIEDTFNLYMYAWEKKLKGVTIFRDGCKRTAILNTHSNKEDKHEVAKDESELSRGDILNCSMDLVGKKRKLQTGCGSLHVLAFFDPTNGELQEVYFNKGSTGGCANFMTGLSRTVSLLCRAGVDIETIKDQLDSCGVCPSYATRSATKHDTSKGSCCPMAIGNALMDMWKEMQEDISDDCDELVAEDIKLPTVDAKTDTVPLKMANSGTLDIDNDICPECGSKLSHIGGCIQCTNCAWSKCG